jgi:hypothetical protein
MLSRMHKYLREKLNLQSQQLSIQHNKRLMWNGKEAIVEMVDNSLTISVEYLIELISQA